MLFVCALKVSCAVDVLGTHMQPSCVGGLDQVRPPYAAVQCTQPSSKAHTRCWSTLCCHGQQEAHCTCPVSASIRGVLCWPLRLVLAPSAPTVLQLPLSTDGPCGSPAVAYSSKALMQWFGYVSGGRVLVQQV
jgi:hypothetical protein